MKLVIRNGVFETNSSSTHSFTIKKTGDTKAVSLIDEKIKELEGSEKTEIDEFRIQRYKKINARNGHVSFIIKSPLAKIVWFLGLLENAESKKYKIDIFVRDSERRDMLYKNAVLEYVSTKVDKQRYDEFVKKA